MKNKPTPAGEPTTEEKKYRTMTQGLRRIYSDETVAGYLNWIINYDADKDHEIAKLRAENFQLTEERDLKDKVNSKLVRRLNEVCSNIPPDFWPRLFTALVNGVTGREYNFLLTVCKNNIKA